MTSTHATDPHLAARPKRADARRNYEKVVAAARDAFTEGGENASLEAIARRAGVGIGTLYRHFPTRQALLEAVYVDEVRALCRSAEDFAEQPPWEALVGWLHGFVAYMATKQALAAEMLNYMDRDAGVFTDSRAAMYAAGGPLLERAQKAGVVRPDVELAEVVQMVGGIAKISTSDPALVDRVLGVALDGLRYRPATS